MARPSGSVTRRVSPGTSRYKLMGTKRVVLQLVLTSNDVISRPRCAEFKDVQGNELFTLRNKLIAIHKTFVAERPDGTDLFKVKASFARK